ncbi:MAG: NAD(P)-binding protein, partial [Pseudomonadota bacterium]
MSKSTLSVAVIGAGLSGVVVANGLVEKGHTVRVFEKSRGVGGRLSTRRVRDEGEAKGVEFDHGAPAVHADGNALRDFLERLDKGGAVAKWP